MQSISDNTSTNKASQSSDLLISLHNTKTSNIESTVDKSLEVVSVLEEKGENTVNASSLLSLPLLGETSDKSKFIVNKNEIEFKEENNNENKKQENITENIPRLIMKKRPKILEPKKVVLDVNEDIFIEENKKNNIHNQNSLNFIGTELQSKSQSQEKEKEEKKVILSEEKTLEYKLIKTNNNKIKEENIYNDKIQPSYYKNSLDISTKLDPEFYQKPSTDIPETATEDRGYSLPYSSPTAGVKTNSNSCNSISQLPSNCTISDMNEILLLDPSRSLNQSKKNEANIGLHNESSAEISQHEFSPSLRVNIQNYQSLTTSHSRRDVNEATQTPSPIPVTLFGAARNQRQKHIKRVSCYILGPLLGEGVFGVVRDAIDTSANRVIPPRFQRVAIKSFKHRRVSAGTSIILPVNNTNEEINNNKNALTSLAKPSFLDSKLRHDTKMHKLLENEVRNLQRFHCPNIIRGIDIFTRHGKDYVVLPLAICNLEQLLQERLRLETRRQRRHNNNNNNNNNILLIPEQIQQGTPTSEIAIDCSAASYFSIGESNSYQWPSVFGERNVSLFSATLVKAIMCQLLNGVLYLHRQGLAHNDLKLQNILLFSDGVLKLTDLGSVLEEYNDQGTPMYISPEICREFYGVDDESNNNNNNNSTSTTIDAKKNDMWSCGVILYYLLMGKPLWANFTEGRNKYQFYRVIASQRTPLNFDYIPEPIDKEEETNNNNNKQISFNTVPLDSNTEPTTTYTNTISSSSTSSSSSFKNLLSRLLDVNPNQRITAEEALQHPALQMSNTRNNNSIINNNTFQQDVARRVLESPHLKALIKRDNEQHLQFVAECCFMLGVTLPDEIFIPEIGSTSDTNTNNNYNYNYHEKEPINNNNNKENIRRITFTGPRGTVDRRLFPPPKDFNYYETKLGKAEYDVRFILNNPAKVKMMQDYLLYTVLVDCGYRSIEEAEEERKRELEKNQRKLAFAESRVTHKIPPNYQQSSHNPSLNNNNNNNNNKENSPFEVSGNGQRKKESITKSPTEKNECSNCLCGLM